MLDNFFNFILNKHCFSCGKNGKYLCNDCINKKIILQANCFICNSKDNDNKLKNCMKCRDNIVLDGILSFFDYHDPCIMEMIKCFKFKYAYDIGKFFGKEIGDIFSMKYKLDSNYIILPVPLYKKKYNSRGFNQSYIIANEISKKTGLCLYSDVLIKAKDTINQVGLKENERDKNLRNTFFIKYDNILRYGLLNKNVILIDDVITTGNTASNCAKILKKNGFNKVFVLTIART